MAVMKKTRCSNCSKYDPRCRCYTGGRDRQAVIVEARALARAGRHDEARSAFAGVGISYVPAFEVVS
jgi:hypothetical protein